MLVATVFQLEGMVANKRIMWHSNPFTDRNAPFACSFVGDMLIIINCHQEKLDIL